MPFPNSLNPFRLRNLPSVREHCEQVDALIATWRSDHNYLVLHRCNCPSFRGNRIDLVYWYKCGTSIHDFERFRNAAQAVGIRIVATCDEPVCAGLEQLATE